MPYVARTSPTRASRGAARENPGLAKGVNVVDGKVTYQPVAEATGPAVHAAVRRRSSERAAA